MIQESFPCLRHKVRRFSAVIVRHAHRVIGGNKKPLLTDSGAGAILGSHKCFRCGTEGRPVGWERRGNQSYYYHSHRVGDRVVKRYIGKGPVAELFAQQMQEKQEAEAQERKAIDEAKARLAGPDMAAARLNFSDVTPVISPAGQRGPSTDQPAGPPIAPKKTPDDVVGRVRALLLARQNGDVSGESELFSLLDEHPVLWQQLGNLTEHAVESWLSLIAGQNLVLRQAVRHRMNHLRAAVGNERLDPVAQLALDRVLVTWLQVAYADSRVAQAGGLGQKAQEFLYRRQTAAQRQHLAALRTWRQWDQSLPLAEDPQPEGSTESASDDVHEDDTMPWIIPFPGVRAVTA